MPITWIEIVDTTVKMGLGAAVTGVITLLVNKQNHARSVEKDAQARNTAALESVTLSIEDVTHALLKHWSFIMEWARNNEKGIKASEEKIKQITELRSEVFHLFKGLTNSEGRLLLLGCVGQQRKLREYGNVISEYHRYSSRSNEQMLSSELETWRTKILETREQLYASLNRAYRAEK